MKVRSQGLDVDIACNRDGTSVQKRVLTLERCLLAATRFCIIRSRITTAPHMWARRTESRGGGAACGPGAVGGGHRIGCR